MLSPAYSHVLYQVDEDIAVSQQLHIEVERWTRLSVDQDL
jgi:hypothetical protein